MQEYQVCIVIWYPAFRPAELKSRELSIRIASLSKDHFIRSSAFIPTALTSMIFASDVPHSWTERSRDIELVHDDVFIQYLISMPFLRKLTIRNAGWLSTKHVQDILGACPELKKVDLRDSGSYNKDPYFCPPGGPRRRLRDVCWGIKGTPEEIAETLVAHPEAEKIQQFMD